ncbi:ArnT family glycosyltransferase [Propionivibrio limicola]|uniref:ArnT family glycosyltransferase n=1 Tax=Propionivibrio limicola TaxID=167645 RepID=UPI001290F629|nr:glycosyltransferase family 39 protein [Propionivibrio limicola]
MPFQQEHATTKGISLPPTGWALAILLVVYIFTGLIGHDPWKHDDALTIGVVHDIFRNGNWLAFELAGQPHPDAPLYYWLASLFAHLFSWLLPVHEAVRLASGLSTLLTLQFILLAARELHGRDYAAAAPLALAGSIGFLYHAHEAQPMLSALTAHTAAYWALALFPRRPVPAMLIFGSAAGLSFLANGLLPLAALLPVTLTALLLSGNIRKSLPYFLIAFSIATIIAAAWLLALNIEAPGSFEAFVQTELGSMPQDRAMLFTPLKYLNLLLWYAWPALPLAAWTLWSRRRQLTERSIALPTLSFGGVLLVLCLTTDVRSAPALLLLPPLILLTVPGIASLRRGAANAFDWFSMMTFSLFAGVVWIGWSAMAFGWPERLARQAVRLEPGFIGRFDLYAFVFAGAATAVWFWLILTSPRSPFRGITHWMAGLTLFWLLLVALWMPWIDYGKSYRPVSNALATALPKKVDCIANTNVAPAILASFDYFDDIRTIPQKSELATKCSWLLAQGDIRKLGSITEARWRKAWDGKRPGDRKESAKFHLFRRTPKAESATALPQIETEDKEALPSL